jgi:hypothetical protein
MLESAPRLSSTQISPSRKSYLLRFLMLVIALFKANNQLLEDLDLMKSGGRNLDSREGSSESCGKAPCSNSALR